jgi:hypothetical protein
MGKVGAPIQSDSFDDSLAAEERNTKNCPDQNVQGGILALLVLLANSSLTRCQFAHRAWNALCPAPKLFSMPVVMVPASFYPPHSSGRTE